MKKTLKHIVFLTPGFAALENDSTTIPVLQVYLNHLKQFLPNVKLTVITFQFPFTSDKYNWNEIEVIPLNGKNSKIKKIFTWRKAYTTLQKLHNENQIDIIHSFWIGECSLIGQYFAHKNKLKHIVTAMGQDVFDNKYVYFLGKDKTKIITLSKNHQDKLQKNYNLNSEIIPWGIDINAFPVIQENSIDILGVGSLNKVKNYPLFIEIISEIVKKHTNIKVEILGKGNELKNIERFIKENNLENNIKLIGEVTRSIVLEKMSCSKILLHTSTYESFGYVFSEALYSGMKIVSFDVGNFIENKSWKISNSKDQFVASILAFLESDFKKNRLIVTDIELTISSYISLYK